MGREYWDYWDYPSTLYQQKFGSVLDSDRSKDGFMKSSLFADSPFRKEFMSRHSNLRQEMMSTGTSTVKNDASQFQVLLDVSQFDPSQVEVKTVDYEVIIHAKHEEREDEHGRISREFTRRIVLPLGVDPMQVTALYDSKGILAIRAPKEVTEKTGKETLIRVEKESASHAPRSQSQAGEKAKSTRDPSSGRKSAEPRQEFFKSSPETSSKDFYRATSTEPGKDYLFKTTASTLNSSTDPKSRAEFFKASTDPKGEYYQSKSTFSSSSVQRTSMTTERPTGTRPKQLVTDV